MILTFCIQDPSGEKRIISLNLKKKTTFLLGRNPNADIVLKDHLLPETIGTLSFLPSASSDKKTDASPSFLCPSLSLTPPLYAQCGDFRIQQGCIPLNLSFQLGETTFSISKTSLSLTLPPVPKHLKAWLTQTEIGKKTLWSIYKAAQTSLPIYLLGETGTGKEILAHLIHAWSPRKHFECIPLHCGALPLGVAESEIFGHVKGAFTGALKSRPGVLLQAHQGTLFLDEIGDLPLEIQVKLLRFLESGEIRPVGSDRIFHTDVRIICATHKSLQDLLDEKKFRRDLYYRVSSVCIEIPPLRARPQDIEMLAISFAKEFEKSISQRVLLRLKAYDWPGNVRELRHIIERAAGTASRYCKVLDDAQFEFFFSQNTKASSCAPEFSLKPGILTLKEMEHAMLLRALKLSNGNRQNAARILGIARSTLFEMLKRHHIIGPRYQKHTASFPAA